MKRYGHEKLLKTCRHRLCAAMECADPRSQTVNARTERLLQDDIEDSEYTDRVIYPRNRSHTFFLRHSIIYLTHSDNCHGSLNYLPSLVQSHILRLTQAFTLARSLSHFPFLTYSVLPFLAHLVIYSLLLTSSFTLPRSLSHNIFFLPRSVIYPSSLNQSFILHRSLSHLPFIAH